MPYIQVAYQSRFHDPLFVYETTDQVTRYCEPACFQWIKSLGKEKELNSIQWMELKMPLSTFAPKPVKENFSPTIHLTCLQKFSLLEEDTPYLVSIFNFFDELEQKKKSPVERLERAIVCGNYPRIPSALMERLVSFAMTDYLESKDGIRFVLSPIIAPYLGKGTNKVTPT